MLYKKVEFKDLQDDQYYWMSHPSFDELHVALETKEEEGDNEY